MKQAGLHVLLELQATEHIRSLASCSSRPGLAGVQGVNIVVVAPSTSIIDATRRVFRLDLRTRLVFGQPLP